MWIIKQTYEMGGKWLDCYLLKRDHCFNTFGGIEHAAQFKTKKLAAQSMRERGLHNRLGAKYSIIKVQI